MVLVQPERARLEIFFVVHYQCHVHEYQYTGSDQQDGIGYVTEDRRAVGEVIPAVRDE